MLSYLKFSPCVRVTAVALAMAGTPCLANPVTEVFLPRYQAGLLAADEPFSDIAVRNETTVGNQTDGEVWLAGRTSLWRWNIGEQALRRYLLIEETKSNSVAGKKPSLARILVEVSGGLLVASGEGLFEIDPGSGKILRYPLPEGIDAETTGLYGMGDRVAWTTKTHWIHLDRYGKRLQAIPLPQPAKGAELVLWSPLSRSLWVARGQSLANTKVVATTRSEGSGSGLKPAPKTTPEPESRQVWLAKSPLAGIAASGGSVFGWTGDTVARFADSGEFRPLETIKVASSRKLSNFSAQLNAHAYLFTDGTLEVYDLLRKQRLDYHLPLPVGRDAGLVSRMMLSGPEGRAQLVVLVAGKPRVFSLAKDLSLSTNPTKLEK